MPADMPFRRAPVTNELKRLAVRAAIKIHERLVSPTASNQQLMLPDEIWNELRRAANRLRLVRQRGWRAACEALIRELDYLAGRLIWQMQLLRDNLPTACNSQVVSCASQIAADLVALAEEFEQFEIDLKRQSISVTTAPIRLEDVYMGPFRIVLAWDRIGSTSAYEVIAQEPHCAQQQDDVTHPHVQSQQLCEGEGAAAIKAALTSGRLFDFFVLVRQILMTYNPASAHVPLDDWDGGSSCSGCGCSIRGDDIYVCDRCGHESCSDCSFGCHACGNSVCSDCSADCAECDQRFCLRCLLPAKEIHRYVCSQCLNNQSQDEPDETEPSPPPPAAASTAGTAETTTSSADTVCVGEALVPPRPRTHRSRRVRRQQQPEPAAGRRRAARPAAVHADERVL
jgi:hypothetical protein